MERFDIPCECGRGLKEFLRATDKSQNPGRYFYKCPYNGRWCLFVWADELMTPKWAHLHPYLKKSNLPAPSCSGYEGPSSQVRGRTRNQSYVMDDSVDDAASRSHMGTSPVSGNVNAHNPFPVAHGSGLPVGVLCCLCGTGAALVSFVVLLVCIVMVKK